ncbi:MAG TPA: Maf family protein [Pseudolabrys sp.]|nr:Maf family protein [Pseudolabrys sp.]
MPLWLAEQPLVLASRSQARGKLLAAAGLWFETRPAEIDERAIEAEAGSPAPIAAAQLLARAKALIVSGSQPGQLVLGADQTLARGSERFSKPEDRAAAADQLRRLSGQTHELHSAIALVRDGAVVFEHADSARLTMRSFDDDFIATYLDAAGTAASASVGGYQLEGIGVHLFEHVEGDYFTILGLPLLPLLACLRQSGWLSG